MNTKLIFSSVDSDWGTPQALFDALNERWRFDLDVCASEQNHKCDRYFDMARDGLAQSWVDASCWMNPPYGRKALPIWIDKAIEEQRLHGARVVMLVPARTDTRWFRRAFDAATTVLFLDKRVRFVRGECVDAAPFPSAVIELEPWGRPEFVDRLVICGSVADL